MKAYQIFQAISPELGKSIFQELRENHRDIYKSTLTSLAGQRRLRPVFVQRKPVPQQIEWLYKTSKLKPVDSVSENLLQLWLLQSKVEMLCHFLDELGIEHEEDGTVEDLPEEVEPDLLKQAVDSLLGKYPQETVALYLRVFKLQQSSGWNNLEDLFANDDRLLLPGQERKEPAPEPKAPTPIEATVTSEEGSEETPAAEEPTEEEEVADQEVEATGEEVEAVEEEVQAVEEEEDAVTA